MFQFEIYHVNLSIPINIMPFKPTNGLSSVYRSSVVLLRHWFLLYEAYKVNNITYKLNSLVQIREQPKESFTDYN